MEFGSWNIRTPMESDNERPERPTGIVAHKLAHLEIDITALSWRRYEEEEQTKDVAG